MSRFLPPGNGEGSTKPRPWRPESLQRVEADALSYLAVDEIVGSAVGLALVAWPQIDEQGRLSFSGRQAVMLGAEREALQRFLSQHRLPRELAERPLRIGDVFGVRAIEAALAPVAKELAAERRLEPQLAPERWIDPPIYDVTADAREAAKISFYAAVTPTLAPEEAAALEELTS